MPSAARISVSCGASSVTARGTTRPSSSSYIDSDTSARGMFMRRPPAWSITVTSVRRRSSGRSTPLRKPSQASAAEPIASRVGPPLAFAASSSRPVSQARSTGPCDSRQAIAATPTLPSTASVIASVASQCSSMAQPIAA